MRGDDAATVASVNVTEVTTDLDPSVWRVVAVTVTGSFLSQLSATIVTVSLASLVSELHSSLATIQWVTSGYLLALTLALPLNGWLVDRIRGSSRRDRKTSDQHRRLQPLPVRSARYGLPQPRASGREDR